MKNILLIHKWEVSVSGLSVWQLSKPYRFTSYASQRQGWYSTLGGSIQNWFFIYPSSTESGNSLLFPLLLPLLLAFCPSLVNKVNLAASNIRVHIGNCTERFCVLGDHCLSINILNSYQKNSLSTWSWKLYLQFTRKKIGFYMFFDFWKRNPSREKKEGQCPQWYWNTK